MRSVISPICLAVYFGKFIEVFIFWKKVKRQGSHGKVRYRTRWSRVANLHMENVLNRRG
jgi:hypothetical protein